MEPVTPYSLRPMLPDGYAGIPAGKIVSVVTELEMLSEPPLPVRAAPQDWSLERLCAADLARYRSIFAEIGREWFWFSRLVMPEADLAALLADPAVQAFAVVGEGRDAGLLELDFREPGAVELAFIGLAAGSTGHGVGSWLMGEAIRRAFEGEARRFWVHTCTLDHPGALGFYRRNGFVPCARSVEVADDPRLTGLMPRDARPDVPILER